MMTTKRYDPELHHRQSARLRGYDYSAAGMYFVTLCTQDHERLLGGITVDVMQLTDAGRMVERAWRELPERFPMVALDEYIVMPNHFHGIILLSEPTGERRVCSNNHNDRRGEPFVRTEIRVRPNLQHNHKEGDHKGRPYGRGTDANSLGRIIQAFKSLTTNAYIRGVKESNWPPFPGRLWQRNYYERIIRDDMELNNVRQYIIDNPARWAEDPENQAAGT